MVLYLLTYLFIIFFLNNLFFKKEFLGSSTGLIHQLFVNKSVPLTGGIFMVLPVIYLFIDYYSLMILTYLLFFCLGLLSDLDILSSSKKRFFIQLVTILIFILITKLQVFPTRINFIDIYFQNSYVSYFFSIFCFLVLINGSNFIDGLNGLLLGYILMIFFYLFKLNLIEFINIDYIKFFYFILIIIFLLFLNFRNKLFLGDSGAYSLSFLLGFILIKIYNNNLQISPYFIIVLLWYPCFENLFSIIRKIFHKTNPLKPDNKHLHQYLFLHLKSKLDLKNTTINNLSSIIINFFNFLIFYFATQNIYDTNLQLMLLLISIVIYLISYKILNNKLKSF